MCLYHTLRSLLPERVILCLLRIEWFRRALVRQGLTCALKFCWVRGGTYRYVFEGSRLKSLSEGLCYIFGGGVGLLHRFDRLDEKLFPEFGTRVVDFGGSWKRNYYWWDCYSHRQCEGRADYLRWLCGCYGIDMDAYFEMLAKR